MIVFGVKIKNRAYYLYWGLIFLVDTIDNE